MPTAVSGTTYTGLVRRARPRTPLLLHKITSSQSRDFSPTLIALHATSALRSSAEPQHPAGAFQLNREINPFELSFTPGRHYTGELRRDGGGAARISGAIASARWEEEQVRQMAGDRSQDEEGASPTPSLAAKPTLSQSDEDSKATQLGGTENGHEAPSSQVSAVSGNAQPSSPQATHTLSFDSTGTASTASAESVLLASDARRRRPSSSTTVSSKPSLSPSSFRVPSLSIAPSAGSSALFDLVRDQLAAEGSVARLQHFQRAPQPLDPLPPSTSGSDPTFFIPTAPTSPPQAGPSSPTASTSQRSLRPNPSFTLSASPNVPPRAQAIFLPPLDQIPTLTPSTTALENARSPPAPPSSSAEGRPAEAAAVDPPSAFSSTAPRTSGRRRHGKGALAAAGAADSSDEDAPSGVGPRKKRRGGEPSGRTGAAPQESATEALERNRQAARKSRGRKKEYIEGLEATEETLARDNELLKAEIAQLQAESLALRQQLNTPHQEGCPYHSTGCTDNFRGGDEVAQVDSQVEPSAPVASEDSTERDGEDLETSMDHERAD